MKFFFTVLAIRCLCLDAGPAVSLQDPAGQELIFLRLAINVAMAGPFALVENESLALVFFGVQICPKVLLWFLPYFGRFWLISHGLMCGSKWWPAHVACRMCCPGWFFKILKTEEWKAKRLGGDP